MRDRMRDSGDRGSFEQITGQVVAYVRSRTADHWLMFVAGLAVGLILG